jgi:hypothetical protein
VLIRFTAPGLHRNNSFNESFWRSHLAMVHATLYTAAGARSFGPSPPITAPGSPTAQTAL